MRTLGLSYRLLAASLLAGAFLGAPPAPAADDPRACCKVIRVDLEKSTVLLRNPRTGKVGQLRLGTDDRERFKIGDSFDPETSVLNGEKLDRTYPMVVPELDLTKAKILRVRGHEVAAKGVENDTVYRFHTVKFDRILSSMRPGQEVQVDEPEGWIYIRVEGYGKVAPGVWAYKLD